MKIKTRLVKNSLILSIGATLLFAATPVFAATAMPMIPAASATLTLTPSVASVTTGKPLTITITEDSGTVGVNAVQVNLTYPQQDVSNVKITQGSAFPMQAANTAKGGTAQLAVGTTKSLTGKQIIGTMVFTAAQPFSATSITVAASSAIISAATHNNIMHGSTLVSTGRPSTMPIPAYSMNPQPTAMPAPQPVSFWQRILNLFKHLF